MPPGPCVFIGVCEFLGVIGLIVPAMTGVKPEARPACRLDPDAGHEPRGCISHRAGKYNFVPINLVPGGVAAFIAYGRLPVRPIVPESIKRLPVT